MPPKRLVMLLSVAGALALAGGCRNAESAGVAPERAERAERTNEPCPTRAEIVSDSLGVWGRARGDVTGDGRPETLFVTRARRSPVRCRYFLVVRTPSRVRALRIPLSSLHGRFQPLGVAAPSLLALVDADPVPGAEVVLTVGHGGTLVFVALFGLRGDELRQFEAPRRVAYVLRAGASGGGASLVDCVRPRSGRLVVTSTERRGRTLTIIRDFLVMRGHHLVPIGRRRDVARIGAIPTNIKAILGRGTLFPTCTVARAS